MSEFQGAPACVAACAAFMFVPLLTIAGQAQGASQVRDPPAPEASEPDERKRILLSELDREQQHLAQGTQRRAQRAAATDAAGARTAEDAVARITENIAALKRELARPAPPVRLPPPGAFPPKGAKAATPSSDPTPSARPWWDVYAHRAPLANKPESTSAAPHRDGDLPPGAAHSRLP